MDRDENDAAALRRLAEAVADGAEVDWNAAGSAAPELMPQLASLRAIATISQWCHRVGEVDTSAAIPTAPGSVGAAAGSPSEVPPRSELPSYSTPTHVTRTATAASAHCWGFAHPTVQSSAMSMSISNSMHPDRHQPRSPTRHATS